MDPTYYLLLIFLPVPIVLISAIIKVLYAGKIQPEVIFNHFPSNKSPAKSTGLKNQKPGRPSAF
jgi:hypothetical protein